MPRPWRQSVHVEYRPGRPQRALLLAELAGAKGDLGRVLRKLEEGGTMSLTEREATALVQATRVPGVAGQIALGMAHAGMAKIQGSKR